MPCIVFTCFHSGFGMLSWPKPTSSIASATRRPILCLKIPKTAIHGRFSSSVAARLGLQLDQHFFVEKPPVVDHFPAEFSMVFPDLWVDVKNPGDSHPLRIRRSKAMRRAQLQPSKTTKTTDQGNDQNITRFWDHQIWIS